MQEQKAKVWVVGDYKKDTDRYLRFITESNVDLIYTSEPWEYREFLKEHQIQTLPLPKTAVSISELVSVIKQNDPSCLVGFILTKEEAERMKCGGAKESKECQTKLTLAV